MFSDWRGAPGRIISSIMDRLKSYMTQIRKATDSDLPILSKLAAADDHAVVFPTHVVERDHQMIGYLSVANVPTVLVWLDTHRANIRDSMACMNLYENMVAGVGAPAVIIPCSEKSPFRSLVEQVGYLDLKCGMFLKPL